MKVWGIASASLVVAGVSFLVLLGIGRDVADAALSAIGGGIGAAFFLGVARARRASRG
jgi:hypothetical protein